MDLDPELGANEPGHHHGHPRSCGTDAVQRAAAVTAYGLTLHATAVLIRIARIASG
jgi:hypothetical protein